ncbi:UNVERIFIED_CONTAM: hypothetical protein Sradi_1563300 [Sesamum radiatum]|uniref:Aminotransferase-like plant mobile domain-containing protein n=1 Tax=Sesamum radiatum TaxID=300843 RepID=A0AAW2U8F2_SESRA
MKFWSKKAIKYHPPSPHKEKKMVWPKSTHNSFGDIATHERWPTAEEALFDKLCNKGNLKEEAYLAVYLSCWLCAFVLPGKDINSIRPSTFKMASMMESGRRVNLAIPVLASIYEAWLPDLPTNAKKLCSETYKAWWAKVHGTFLDDNIACLISPKPIKITLKRKKHEDKQVDGGGNNPSHAFVPSVVIKYNPQAVVAEASKGKGPSHNLTDNDSSNKDHHSKIQKN